MNQATPVIVLSHVRSGGTMLMEALSNHPDIFAPRGEVLLPASSFQSNLRADPADILKAVTTPEMYRYGAAKVQWTQMSQSIMNWIEWSKMPVIKLYRENILRVAVSGLLAGRKGKQHHTFDHENDLGPENLKASNIFQLMDRIHARQEAMGEYVAGLRNPTLTLRYRDLVGYEGNETDTLSWAASRRICEFLDLKPTIFPVSIRKTTRKPLSHLMPDWASLQYMVRNSEYRNCLQDEERYERLYANRNTDN